MVNIKRRFAHPSGDARYRYDLKGHGTPAWCSSNILEASELLIIEGELNGMACWCVRPDIAVMGIAGTNGCLWTDVLKDKTVYVYGDGDKPGQEARDKWALAAYYAKAKSVLTLEAWEMDACDVLGKHGREALRECLE